MHRLLILSTVFLLLIATYVQAQIVIRAQEFPHTVGMVFDYYSEVGDSIPVNVGVPGGPQTWDYTQGDTSNITTDTYLDPSTAPPELSRANVVIETSQLNLVGLTDSGIMYGYFHPARFIVGGVQTTVQGEIFTLVFEPYLTPYNLPLQYGNTWSNAINFDEIYEFPEYDIRIELQGTMDSQVDAWGNVLVPLGDFDALRIKNYVDYDLTVSIRFLWVWIPIYTESKEAINYEWRAPNVGTVLHITSDSTDPYFTQAKSVRRLLASSEIASSAIEDITATAVDVETCELMSGYPNPFNNETVISYSLNEPALVELQIFDIMGREVSLLERGIKPEGISQVQWKPSPEISAGVYFVQLRAGEQTKLSSLIYLK